MAVTGFPKRQLVGEDIDSCEAPLDDSREPRFPVIGRRRSESWRRLAPNSVPVVAQRQPFTRDG
jgi:hypothetical protein